MAGCLSVAPVVQSQPCEEQKRLGLRVTESQLGQGVEASIEVRFGLIGPPQQKQRPAHEGKTHRLVPSVAPFTRAFNAALQHVEGGGRIRTLQQHPGTVDPRGARPDPVAHLIERLERLVVAHQRPIEVPHLLVDLAQVVERVSRAVLVLQPLPDLEARQVMLERDRVVCELEMNHAQVVERR